MDQRVRTILEAAIAAWSPNNTQPFRFRVTHTGLDAGLDEARLLRTVDPTDRCGWVALGAAAECARLAGLTIGMNLAVGLRDDPVWPVQFTIVPGMAPMAPGEELLAGQIRHRRSFRGPMQGPPATSSELYAAARAALPGARTLELPPSERGRLLDCVEYAIRDQGEDRRSRRELHRWIRPWPWQRDPVDGVRVVDLGLPDRLAPLAPFAFSAPFDGRFGMPRRFARRARRIVDTSPDLVLLTSARDDPAGWFAGGAGWQRYALSLTAAGLVTHAVSAPLEVEASVAEVRRIYGLGRNDGLLALVRIGRAPRQLPPAPTRPVESFLA